jgi:hypothetical protein
MSLDPSLSIEIHSVFPSDRVDQYEFVVASLLSLEKISKHDVEPIMNKFRELAGNLGYITLDAIYDEDDTRSHDINCTDTG